jgi:hypothetical protein
VYIAAAAGGGALQINPLADGNESSQHYYSHASKAVTVAGDVWYVGNGPYGAGIGNYGIATSTIGLCLTISSAGVVNIPGSLTVAGNNLLPWATGRVSSAGAQVYAAPGQSSWTCANTGTGTFTVTFGTAHPQGTNYVCLVSLTGPSQVNPTIQANSTSSTVVTVITAANGTVTSLPFSFSVR